MKVLLIGNGFLSMAHQELHIAAGLKQAGNEVVILHDPQCSEFNKGYIPPPLLSKEIIIKKPGDFEVEKGIKGVDCCLGLDQSVSALTRAYESEYHCPASCIMLDYPRHMIDEGSPQDYDPEYSANYYTAINYANEMSGGIIFTSKTMALRAANNLRKPPYYFYYPLCTTNAIDGKKFDIDVPYIASTHKFFSYNGTEYLIKALSEMMVDYCAAFAGGFIEPQVIAFAQRMLADKFHPYPKLAEANKWRLLKSAKVLCYPNLCGWSGGMAVLEALYMGTPVVCSDFPLYKEFFGDSVVYTAPKNIDDLQEKLLLVLNKEIDLETLKARGKERVQLMFTPEQAGKALTQILEHVCNESSVHS
jgi:glycosyltransferase involved in cell wall biosynthesis